jgi:hypothetical protein
MVKRPPQVTLRVAAYRPPAPEHPLECGLEQVLTIVLAARQEDSGMQQVLALDDEQFLEHIGGLFAVHHAPLVDVTHQVRAAQAGG